MSAVQQPDPKAVQAALDQIIDPELGRSLVQLGLVQEVEIEGAAVYVGLQLTSPRCPHADDFIGAIKDKVGAVPGVGEVEVELLWPAP